MGLTTLAYESNIVGAVIQVEVGDDIVALAGTPPTSAPIELTAYVDKPSRRYGIEARHVVIGMDETTPSGRVVPILRRIPILTEAQFNSAALALNAPVTFGTETFTVRQRVSENSV